MERIIFASVGFQGVNRFPDVRAVQTMLNFIDPTLGGADPALRIDSLVGPKTIGAIRNFQEQNIGFSDGVMSSRGRTIRKMAELFAPASGPSAPKMLSLPRITTPSGWAIQTTGGFDVSVSFLGFIKGQILVTEDAKPSVSRKLVFDGAGLSAGPMPIGLDFSSVSAPGSGTRIFSPPGVKTPITFSDLTGPALIISGGGTFSIGGSASLIVFGIAPGAFFALQAGSFLLLGPAGISPLLPAIFASKGVGIAFGVQAGIPNIGISIYGAFVRAA